MEYVRQKGINRLRYQELIVELARSQESIKKQDVVELLHITESQAYRLLDKLIKDGRLVREGNTVATIYKLSE